jgi:hypothetical protein
MWRVTIAVAHVVAECNRAQRVLTQLNYSPDRYRSDPDTPPDTYAEFLFRTSGVIRHEPSADKRVSRPPARH